MTRQTQTIRVASLEEIDREMGNDFRNGTITRVIVKNAEYGEMLFYANLPGVNALMFLGRKDADTVRYVTVGRKHVVSENCQINFRGGQHYEEVWKHKRMDTSYAYEHPFISPNQLLMEVGL